MAASKPLLGAGEAVAGRPPAGAEAPLVDYQQQQKRKETMFWVTSVGAFVGVAVVLWLVYNQLLTPKYAQIAQLQSQINQERSKEQTYEKEQKALPAMRQLNEVVQVKWAPIADKTKSIWFFKDYWEIIDNIFTNMIDVAQANTVLPVKIKFKIFEGAPTQFPADWSEEKITQRIEEWAAGNIEQVIVGGKGMSVSCTNLLCPLEFEAEFVGEYERLMGFLDAVAYDSNYLYAVKNIKLTRVGEFSTFLTFTPIGTMENMKVTGAAWFLNPTGTPNTDFVSLATSGAGAGAGGGGAMAAGGSRTVGGPSPQ